MKLDDIRMKAKVMFPGLLLGVVALGILAVSGATGQSKKANLLELDGEISRLKSEIRTQEEAVREQEQLVVKSVTGADIRRVDKDNGVAESFFKETLAWSNLDEYNAKRKLLMDTYGMDSQDAFLSVFMPDVSTVKDKDGNEYQRENVNVVTVLFSDLSSRVVKLSDDVYTYFTEVSLHVEDVNREGSSGTALCIFQYDVDGDGNLSNLSGYTVADIQE